MACPRPVKDTDQDSQENTTEGLENGKGLGDQSTMEEERKTRNLLLNFKRSRRLMGSR
jgi:hypothetical protein